MTDFGTVVFSTEASIGALCLSSCNNSAQVKTIVRILFSEEVSKRGMGVCISVSLYITDSITDVSLHFVMEMCSWLESIFGCCANSTDNSF
ncbi:MAG: hypothetical protein JXR76_24340 [Deltaproteobacteria bacterium]|nr:hypothetical protein [Deltaproteobacteria bacterium]